MCNFTELCFTDSSEVIKMLWVKLFNENNTITNITNTVEKCELWAKINIPVALLLTFSNFTSSKYK